MRIAIIGYSGSGKSTTAKILAKQTALPLLHLDSVHFLPEWKERSDEECRSIVAEFLHKDGWIIDGNYARFCQEQRLAEADLIVWFNFGRVACFVRAFRRYLKYRGQTRPDLGEGCPEKFDGEFVRWLLWEGRTRTRHRKFTAIAEKYSHKTVILRNQRELTAFLKNFERSQLLMNRTKILLNLEEFPPALHPLLSDAEIYDSSCSPEARVWFIDRDGGYYLKSAPPTTLERESVLTDYFHSREMASEVCYYRMNEMGRDWMLTKRVIGEDCTNERYLADPKRLATAFGERLRILHETNCADCPFDHRKRYFAVAESNHQEGLCDLSYATGFGDYRTPDEAWGVIEREGHLLKADTLLHGDYCLPNVIFDDWRFSGFVDLGNGRVGDRHVDLYWGVWTLRYNLKTDAYAECFLDAYGRDKIEEDMFRVIAAFEVFG